MAHTFILNILYSEFDKEGSIHMETNVSEESNTFLT